jgi:hypothetical protein
MLFESFKKLKSDFKKCDNMLLCKYMFKESISKYIIV